LGNEFIEFKARFAGVAREIIVPVSRVLAIYARENGQGMAFPLPVTQPTDAQAGGPSPLRAGGLTAVDATAAAEHASDEPQPPAPPSGRPTLTRVK
jgi:stringent starvation protein B